MYKKITTVFAFATIVSAGAFAATPAADVTSTTKDSGQTNTRRQPKVTMKQARATALKKAPGKVTSEELENEKGTLIYSFDIATSKVDVMEVNVDAMTGKIVAVQHENAAKEAAEKKQEAKEKKDGKH